MDTSQAYGEAEQVLGRTLTQGHGFAVISKLPAQAQLNFTAVDQSIWEAGFKTSCQRLGLSSLDALLLHSPADLRKPGGEWLGQWLISLRERGLVHRIGVSIYAAEDLEGIDPVLLDLVQLPLSLYDQRLLQDGTIERLHSQGCAIHARSVLLQGLLVQPVEYWPKFLSTKIKTHHSKFIQAAESIQLTLQQLSLAFVRQCSFLEAVLVGVTSSRELSELLDAWSPLLAAEQLANDPNWAWLNATDLDPRRWPSL